MKRSFILIGMMMVFLSLFGEGVSKGAKACSVYEETMGQNFDNSDAHIHFIPDWFEHLEFADNNSESGYSKEFLQEHGGRAGKIVIKSQEGDCFDDEDEEYNDDDDYEEEDIDIDCYSVSCSGTLIGNNYFITAGHCARTELMGQKFKNVGVLFSYQKADFENNDDDDSEYPRVSLTGYLNNDDDYVLYEDSESEYSNFKKHPAYFPIIKDDCNNDRSVENGWGDICWIKDGNKEHRVAATTMWLEDGSFPFFRRLGKIDYAIYKLGTNNDGSLPEDIKDLWPWESENNQLFRNTLAPNLVMPWQLPDNTNGARGWTRVNTAVLQTGSTLTVIGSPGVAKITDEIKGLKVVNAGSVKDGKGRGYDIESNKEDVLIFQGADIQVGHSGSSVIDSSGRLAGVAAWINCAKGWEWIYDERYNQPAENYATPMWKICRASQIVKDAARDIDCNGQIDWWDDMEKLRSFSGLIKISDIWFGDLDFSSSVNVKNYRYDPTQQKVITETNELPAYTYQVILPDNGDLFYVAKQNGIFYLFQNGTALGAISNYPNLFGSSALVKSGDIYLAGGDISGVSDQGLIDNDDTQYVTKISSDGQNGYNFSIVTAFPTNLEDIRIFALGNDIYVSGNTSTNFAVYKLVADNQSGYGYSLSVINSSQPVRKDYNLTASDGKIIVSGGATDYIRNVLNIEEGNPYPEGFAVYNNIIMLEPAVSNNWVTVAENINDKLIMMSVTAIENGELVIINPFITVGNSMQKIVMDLSEIPINGENLRVDFEFDPVVYCLNESENTLSGGLTISGECVPFTHPRYSSFSAGATVYSLDGKGERLYVGTNNAIKIYDISDPISPVLVSSFSTSSRVNDLEVYGDSLFAATNGGLYKLDASDPDELTQILFISTVLNYQYKVEVDSGKLYVGEDNGIKVRDLDTMSVLTSVNNGSVLDFAIENGEIGLYKDALFSPVEIRDAETLTLKANEFFGCFEIEVGSSDGRFYLSCDDETYRFEDDGDGGISFTELSGDIRELQDVYTFDGYTYFYDENTIWISTSNDVPAICGNCIVEGDEVCDGGQIDCTELDVSGNVSTNSGFVSGIAACNSTCNGYILDNCSSGNGGDGW